MNNKILIIGGGRIGQSLKNALNKSKPTIWDIDPKVSDSEKSLEDETKNKDFIFLCLPTIAIAQTLVKIKSNLQKETIVICISKGLNEKNKFTYEILQNELIDTNWGILAGPLMAEEINNNQPTVAVLALKNPKQFQKAKDLFSTSPIKIIHSNDLRGLSMAGALKNVYALFLGMVDEADFSNNLKAYFITKSLREIKIISQMYKAKQTTISSLAGLADLIVTVISPHSLDFKTGQEIIKGKKNVNSEGLKSILILDKKIKNKSNLPLFETTIKIIKEPKNAQSLIENLLPR